MKTGVFVKISGRQDVSLESERVIYGPENCYNFPYPPSFKG